MRLETNLRTADGAELWSDKFDGDLEAAFDWQDEVGGKIASMILMSIAEIQKQYLNNRPIVEMSAEECELLAQLRASYAKSESFRGFPTALKCDSP